jgi:hypothetical protein
VVLWSNRFNKVRERLSWKLDRFPFGFAHGHATLCLLYACTRYVCEACPQASPYLASCATQTTRKSGVPRNEFAFSSTFLLSPRSALNCRFSLVSNGVSAKTLAKAFAPSIPIPVLKKLRFARLLSLKTAASSTAPSSPTGFFARLRSVNVGLFWTARAIALASLGVISLEDRSMSANLTSEIERRSHTGCFHEATSEPLSKFNPKPQAVCPPRRPPPRWLARKRHAAMDRSSTIEFLETEVR